MFISHSHMLSYPSLQSQSLQMSKNGCFFAGSSTKWRKKIEMISQIATKTYITPTHIVTESDHSWMILLFISSSCFGSSNYSAEKVLKSQ